MNIKKFINPKTKAYIRNTLNKIFSKPLRYIAETYEELANPKPQLPPKAKSGWSIILLTAGNSKDFFDRFVLNAHKEMQTSDYEIVVVGPPTLDLSYFDKEINIVHAPYKQLVLWTVPFAISKWKNFGVKHAKYDKIVVSHDYLYFLPGWKEGYDSFGDDFTVCTNAVLDQDGNRHMDWITWDYPGVGIGLLPYTHECTEYQVIGGNYFVVKRDFFLENPMNENLRWGEAEDIDWAFMIRKKTKFKVNPESKVQYSKFKKGVWGPWFDGTKKLEVILGQKIL